MMKDYRRMMEQVTLSDRKKEEIMDMLENKETKKRRIPSVAKAALAAALVVGCLVSGAVATRQPEFIPDFTPAVKITVEGNNVNYDFRMNNSHHEWPNSNPIQLKNGRLWFINGKEYTDITDMIDEETPYVGVQTDPDTGEITAFLALGGTPEDFGYIVSARTESPKAGACGLYYLEYTLTYDGVTYQVNNYRELPDEVYEAFFQNDNGVTYSMAYKPWVVTAVKEIGIDWFDVDLSAPPSSNQSMQSSQSIQQ